MQICLNIFSFWLSVCFHTSLALPLFCNRAYTPWVKPFLIPFRNQKSRELCFWWRQSWVQGSTRSESFLLQLWKGISGKSFCCIAGKTKDSKHLHLILNLIYIVYLTRLSALIVEEQELLVIRWAIWVSFYAFPLVFAPGAYWVSDTLKQLIYPQKLEGVLHTFERSANICTLF